jgi:hypothetical protein
LLNLFGEAVGETRLDGLYDPGMEHAAARGEERPVRHLVREGVLERVLEVGKEARLVEELSGLQVVESATERLVREVGYGLEQSPRHLLPDDGSDLEEAFVLRSEPVNACRQHHLDGGWDLDRQDRLRQLITSRLPCQGLCLNQRPDGLLQKERVPAPDEELLKG